MVKEHFSIAGSRDVLALIDEAGRKAGLARGQAFEDFLTFVRCCLSGQTMEEEYLATVRKGYDKGKTGKRGIDIVAKAFAMLVKLMDRTGEDVLGDIFQAGVTNGKGGQFFTPEPVTELLARLSIGEDDGSQRKSVCDPACGSGRALLAIGKKYPHWDFTGQDVDHRCAQMTAISMGLCGLFGHAVWQNTLTLEVYRVYRIGFNLQGGVIREIPVGESQFSPNTPMPSKSSDINPDDDLPPKIPDTKPQQRDLF